MSVPNNVDATGQLGLDTQCGNPGELNIFLCNIWKCLGNGVDAAISGLAWAAGGAYDYVMIPSGSCQPADPAIALNGNFPVDR